MPESQQAVINIIAKLMNESESGSELSKNYSALYKKIQEELPEVLDKGVYTDNAKIVRSMNKALAEKKIFLTVPELAGKTVVSVCGHADSISRLLRKISSCPNTFYCNKSVPTLILPSLNGRKSAMYALTYIDKLLELSAEEYRCITSEMYKHNIDLQKLVKAFVVFLPSVALNHQAILLFPEYVNVRSNFVRELIPLIHTQFFISDNAKDWEKIATKLSVLCNAIYLIGNEKDKAFIEKNFGKDVTLCTAEVAKKICSDGNVPCINYLLSTEFEVILQEIEAYCRSKKQRLETQIASLAKDSFKTVDEELKKSIHEYRDDLVRLKKSVEENYNRFSNFRKSVIQEAANFEDELSDFHKRKLTELTGNINAEKYIANLLAIFFKYINSGRFVEARILVEKLQNVRYKYASACSTLLYEKSGLTSVIGNLSTLNSYPDTVAEIAKIKIALSRQLHLYEKDLQKLVNYAKPVLDTAEEYYWLGKKLLADKDFIGAKNCFERALSMDYDKAGDELIKLADAHSECNIDMEFLAENLVSEANYRVGIKNKDTPKGVVNLAMAASKYHVRAMEYCADNLYMRLPSYMPNNEQTSATLNSLIKIYEYLAKKQPNEIYKRKTGVLHFRLKEYRVAFELLKDCSDIEALYYCGVMCQSGGQGVSLDLKRAKKFFSAVINLNCSYKDSLSRYNTIVHKLAEVQSVSHTHKNSGDSGNSYSSYNESKSYKTTRQKVSSAESSDCVITTATCNVLQKGRDCDELNMLRSFRDSYIIGDGKGGDELIAEYRRIAPGIVESLAKEPDCEAIYGQLWTKYILPSCAMVKENRLEEAKMIYIDMVKTLCEKYNVQVKDSIVEKYSF